MLVSFDRVVEDVLVGVDGAKDRPLVDADLDRGLGYVLRDEKDKRYFVDSGLADKYSSRVILVLRKLQVIWRSVHCFSRPFDMFASLKAIGCFVKGTLLERLLCISYLCIHAQLFILKSTDFSLTADSICECSMPYPFTKAVEWTETFIDISLLRHKLFIFHDW